jgi:hypothetical protein
MAKTMLPIALLLALFLASSITQAAGKGFMPVSCQLKLDKDELATGERMKIWAWYFLDDQRLLPMAKSRIVVVALKGEILNGVQVASEPPGYKAFQVRDGIVELDYEAPEQCPDEPEKITVYNSLDNLPVKTRPMDLTGRHEKIGYKGIKLICPQGLTLTQTILRRTESSGSMSLLDIKVKVRIRLKGMGGSAVSAKNAEVIQFSGKDLYVSGDQRDEYNLTGASVGSMSGAFQIFRSENGQITYISLPPMSVLLSWRGDGGIVPPAEIVIGPVRNSNKKQRRAHIKALRQARKRAEGKPPMEIYGEVMLHLEKVLTDNPDLQTTSIGNKYSASGGGEINRPEPDGIDKETFKWVLTLRKK